MASFILAFVFYCHYFLHPGHSQSYRWRHGAENEHDWRQPAKRSTGGAAYEQNVAPKYTQVRYWSVIVHPPSFPNDC